MRGGFLFALCAWAGAWAQAPALSGKVTDAAGVPLEGVLVRILAGTLADTTGVDGLYALNQTAIGVRRVPGQGNLPGTFRTALTVGPSAEAAGMLSLQGRRLHPGPIAAGAYVRPAWSSAVPDPMGRKTPAAKPSAAPEAWIQAYKPGFSLVTRKVPSGATAVDIVLTPSTDPDFGPNVLLFHPALPMADIQSQCDTVFGRQVRAQFGEDRFAFLFKPGAYSLNVDVAYYTQVLGLGRLPGDVTINGSVRSQTGTGAGNQNVTIQFWRTCENLAINPTNASKSVTWAVSQGVSLRRTHVKGSLNLSIGGWASGGYLGDIKVDGQVASGSQQQWFSRNSQWTNWVGGVWNMFFLGVVNPPMGTWPVSPYTVIPQTPVHREKPFLTVDAGGKYAVFVPGLRRTAQGISWGTGPEPGRSIPLDSFHLAKPGPSDAAALNAALGQGKHILLTPGIYFLSAPVRVTRPGTVVLGLGLATMVPVEGTSALEVGDVDGVTVSGVVFDAGPRNSAVLLRVGEPGSARNHAEDPTVLHDIFLRVGGPREGSADTTVAIHSSHVVADHFWVWRADHGTGAKWEMNRGANGLVVTGADVTAYGMFVEHYQEYQTVWTGEGGRTYFYQCEMPYDPPSQDLWRNGTVKGWAGYKVGPGVTTHAAAGLGIYSAFKQLVVADHAIEAPVLPGVDLSHMVAVWLNGADGSGINSVLNGTGGAVTRTRTKATLD